MALLANTGPVGYRATKIRIGLEQDDTVKEGRSQPFSGLRKGP